MSFYDKLDQFVNTEITVIIGNNSVLFDKLKGKYKNLRILGFVDKVYEYMKKADIIISKPSGITTFEAIYAEVPIIAFHPFLQQEVYNAEFIKEKQIGLVMENAEGCMVLIEKMLIDGKQLNQYKENMKKLKNISEKTNWIRSWMT
ncbi:MAG: glycosyltransferase [Anaerocolumna sp.]